MPGKWADSKLQKLSVHLEKCVLVNDDYVEKLFIYKYVKLFLPYNYFQFLY